MKEIEIKILEIDKEAVEARLLEIGAKKEFEGELHAIFYDEPDGRIREGGDVLRLRKEGDEVVLAYKARISKDGAKVMEEYETAVSDMEAMRQILRSLRFEAFTETRKFRTEYLISDVKVVIDEYKDELEFIPVFLEIEASSEEKIRSVTHQLGFQASDCKSWDTYDLVRHYGKSDSLTR